MADGNLWFTIDRLNDALSGTVAQITPSGIVSQFPVPTPSTTLNGITLGPDGSVWFADGLDNNLIGQIVIAPTITLQPANQTIVSGTTATLSVTASGTAPLYQWFIGVSGVTTNPIAGATETSYTTPALTGITSYWVQVSNDGGTANSRTATITAVTAPTITVQPASQTIASGTTATLSVTAGGTAPLAYHWYVGTSGALTNPIAGATASSYTTPALTATTSYWVQVSNAGGAANSNTATITVVTAPTITTQPASQTVTVEQNAQFMVAASGTPAPTYQWQLLTNGVWSNLSNGAPYSGVNTATLTVSGPAAGLTGTQYRCVAANSVGSATSSAATLTVVTHIALDDFDGDGKAEITVYRPSTGGWYVLRSSTNYTTYTTFQWGIAGDMPVRGDFDGDGKEVTSRSMRSASTGACGSSCKVS